MSHIQKQVLYKALSEPIFGKEILSKLPAKSFDDTPTYKELAILINRYYMTNDSPIDMNTLLTLVETSLTKQGRNEETLNTFYQSIKDLYSIDYELQNDDLIGEEIQKYVRRNLAYDAISKTLLEGKLEDENSIDTLIERLSDIVTLNALGKNSNIIDFFQDIELKKDALANIKSTKLPSGLLTLDTIAEGGIARGELALVIAKSGGGKTLIASNIASNAVKQGFNTMYFSLEEKIDRMVLRLEQILSQQTKSNLMPDGSLDENLYDSVQQAYTMAHNKEKNKNPWGELYIAKFMPGEMTPNIMEQTIVNQQMRTGKNIDVVIIDYPDLMNNPHLRTSENESRAGGRLFEDLRKFAQKYDFGCWALSQVNRSGFEKDIIDSSAIEGSKQKINACELVLAVNQTPEEFKEGFLRLYIDKLRNSSGTSYDKMLQFKVVPSVMTVRDEVENEVFYHQQLLTKQQEFKTQDHSKTKPNTTQQANQVIDALNGGIVHV